MTGGPGERTNRGSPEQLFRQRFGREPTHRVRAPGRVNLIGEHTDYNGLPVLPMALGRATRLTLRPRRDAVVRVLNADPAFGEREFRISPELRPGPSGDWENYLKAAARHLARRPASGEPELHGFDAVLDSDVPVAAGLSSSATLVVAVGLALVRLNGLPLEPLELADAMAEAERFVGTRGGGMDQAVCLGARAGHAARIDFDPLRMTHVAVPEGWSFVVAHTLVRAEKSGTAREAYNRRTEECAEALARVRGALAAAGRAGGDDRGEGARRRRASRADTGDHGAVGYRELLARYDPGTLLDVAGSTLGDPLRRRFRHVVTEGRRVEDAVRALDEDRRADFGRLMDASHASLRDDYEVSSPELDELVGLAREAGAEGARLTGAGFGGCIVALCAAGETAGLMGALEEGYYARRRDLPDRDERLFSSKPSAGAALERL